MAYTPKSRHIGRIVKSIKSYSEEDVIKVYKLVKQIDEQRLQRFTNNKSFVRFDSMIKQKGKESK